MTTADSSASARTLRDDLAPWQRRFPCLPSRDIAGLAPLIASHLPDAAADDRVLAMLVSLWIVIFDEMVDSDQVAPGDAAALAARCLDLVAGATAARPPVAAPAATTADQLAHLLVEMLAWVDRFAAPPALTAYWRAAFAGLVRAIVAQRAVSRDLAAAATAGPPPLDSQFFTTLKESIGVPLYLATALLIARDATLVDRWPAVLGIIDACAAAIRLANDLRTWPKDEREGSLNTLVMLEADLGRAEPASVPEARRAQALADLRRRLDHAIAATHAHLAASPGAHGPWERGVSRLVDAATAWYRDHDDRAAP